MRKMCPYCGKKMRKERVTKLMNGRLGYNWYCPNCDRIRVKVKI
jgi:rubredoxin